MPDESGEVPVFASLEARCDACQVYGGPQNPCQPAGLLRRIEEETTKAGRPRPCPRIFLDAENGTAWELLPLLATESVAFPALFELLTADLDRDEALATVRRIYYALGHPEFRAAKKDAERDAARRAKAEHR